MRKQILLSLLAAQLSVNMVKAQFKLTENGFLNSQDETKDYIVIDIPDTPKEKLFEKTKLYLNTIYI